MKHQIADRSISAAAIVLGAALVLASSAGQSFAWVAHRGTTVDRGGAVYHRGTTAYGSNNVYHRGSTAMGPAGGIYHRGVTDVR